jgi:Pilus formation protein N terminal region
LTGSPGPVGLLRQGQLGKAATAWVQGAGWLVGHDRVTMTQPQCAAGPSGAMAMVEQRPNGGLQAAIGRPLNLAAFLAGLLFATPACFADQTTPLSVERPSKQTMVLTQGFSTTIHSERQFGKVYITDPDIVDMVLRTDKSAVLIPQRLGRTNIDFLDDHGSLIGSMDVRVIRQSITDRVVIYDRPSLGAYSTFHCGPNGCAHFEEMPDKEEALSPGAAQRTPMGVPQ